MPARRQTLAEARLKGDQAGRDHRRRYGTAPTAADLAEGELRGQAAPKWADKPPMREAFARIVEAGPSGLLRQVDYDLVTALAEAIARFELAARTQRRGRRAGLDPLALWRLTRDVREAGPEPWTHPDRSSSECQSIIVIITSCSRWSAQNGNYQNTNGSFTESESCRSPVEKGLRLHSHTSAPADAIHPMPDRPSAIDHRPCRDSFRGGPW
jgi:hypothetical protein